MMKPKQRRQAIAEEWMLDTHTPARNISRLRRRATYSEATLWWLMAQMDLLDPNSLGGQLKQLSDE